MATKNKIFRILKTIWLELVVGIFGVFMLSNSLLKEEINDTTKFIELTSQLTSFEFRDGSRGHRHYYL